MSTPPSKSVQKGPSEEKKKVVMKDPELGKTILKNLVMGGTAGIIGACSTYPLDMVKTRMQNQKTGEKLYNNSLDCFRKIIRADGIRGLYRGLPAQLIGITPEKAIKLTVNDFLRYTFTNKETGEIKVYHEAIAGSAAGFSQVVVTNPYELVKVRLQTSKQSATSVLKELGLRGLLTGAPATLLRDVPFSALYFTMYGNLKKHYRDENGHIPFLTLFGCSGFAGMIAAGAVTPADVIKTRIQVKTTEGAVKYNGIADCFNRILKEEGPRALFKGAVPRMMIISPLFAITLGVYEVLQGYFL
eukprot:TRINITY_DN8300_c0_g1_i1.p1 TRINITY_DN8300_c0_g1~~TRINITY_DN8300_c0_g1_i1.p1  ORF type:complete len:301 (+),score=60.32 TRINITY_DN8300_c0_g1_i1:143-1045(+)